ncbi:hypothetical protein F5X97DRAFT_328071 [Nemania serpens]|nr:hypothetical protein F5X97DRAFT_328071 [Nemania serpens]
MRIIERQMPCSSVKCPHALYASLRRLCDRKGYEIESLELRNDTYFIRLRVPELNANDDPAGSSHRPSDPAPSNHRSA